MDQPPRRTDRWLPVLGIALIAEAAALAGVELKAESVIATLAAALGIVTLLRSFRPANPTSWAIPGFSIFALIAVMLLDSFISWEMFGSRMLLRHLQIPARTLMVGGATLLWAAALARREHPADEKLALLGRIGAGLAQVGFLFAFVQEIPSWGDFARVSSPSQTAPLPVFSLLRLVYRAMLLWASIEMMRSGTDPEVLRKRCTGVHHLMIGWATVMIVSSVLLTYSFGLRTPSPPVFMRQLVTVSASVTVAFTLARRFRMLPKESSVPA